MGTHDKEQETIYYNRQSKQHVVQNSDGTIEGKSGGTQFKMQDDGVTVNLSQMKCFGIKDIQNISKYKITTDGGVVTHAFEYRNGSNGLISFEMSGKLLEFSLHGNGAENPISVNATLDGEVLISSIKD